jgi:hypothetical protein
MEVFQKDLLESVQQMRRSHAGRVTRMKVQPAGKPRATRGRSRPTFKR